MSEDVQLSPPGGTRPRSTVDGRVGQVDATRIPRFAGPPTFARLPRIDEVTPLSFGATVPVFVVTFALYLLASPATGRRPAGHPGPEARTSADPPTGPA